MAASSAVRVVLEFVPNSSWVRAETTKVQVPNREQAVKDVLEMVFPNQRHYNVKPRNDGAIFVQFFYVESAKRVQGHVWGSGPETMTFYSVPHDTIDKMPLVANRWIQIA